MIRKWMLAFLIGMLLAAAVPAVSTALAVSGGEKTNRTITINGGEFPPFTMNDNREGAFIEITKAAFAKKGYRAKFTNYPFSRAVSMLQTGTLDAALNISYTKERTAFCRYSDKIYSMDLCLFKLKNGKLERYTGVEGLKEYRCVALLGSVWEKRLRGGGVKCEGVPDIVQGIGMLLKGRVDLVVGVRDIVTYKMKKNFSGAQVSKVVAVEPPLQVDDSYLAFSKKLPESQAYRDDFNQGLKLIKKDGTYSRIIKKYGLTP